MKPEDNRNQPTQQPQVADNTAGAVGHSATDTAQTQPQTQPAPQTPVAATVQASHAHSGVMAEMQSQQKKSKNKLPLILGIVGGIFAFLFIVGAVFAFLKYRSPEAAVARALDNAVGNIQTVDMKASFNIEGQGNYYSGDFTIEVDADEDLSQVVFKLQNAKYKYKNYEADLSSLDAASISVITDTANNEIFLREDNLYKSLESFYGSNEDEFEDGEGEDLKDVIDGLKRLDGQWFDLSIMLEEFDIDLSEENDLVVCLDGHVDVQEMMIEGYEKDNLMTIIETDTEEEIYGAKSKRMEVSIKKDGFRTLLKRIYTDLNDNKDFKDCAQGATDETFEMPSDADIDREADEYFGEQDEYVVNVWLDGDDQIRRLEPTIKDVDGHEVSLKIDFNWRDNKKIEKPTDAKGLDEVWDIFGTESYLGTSRPEPEYDVESNPGQSSATGDVEDVVIKEAVDDLFEGVDKYNKTKDYPVIRDFDDDWDDIVSEYLPDAKSKGIELVYITSAPGEIEYRSGYQCSSDINRSGQISRSSKDYVVVGILNDGTYYCKDGSI